MDAAAIGRHWSFPRRSSSNLLKAQPLACHGVGGVQGTVAAPGLAGTASILPAATLENLLLTTAFRCKSAACP
jgi:hypothetical protein